MVWRVRALLRIAAIESLVLGAAISSKHAEFGHPAKANGGFFHARPKRETNKRFFLHRQPEESRVLASYRTNEFFPSVTLNIPELGVDVLDASFETLRESSFSGAMYRNDPGKEVGQNGGGRI